MHADTVATVSIEGLEGSLLVNASKFLDLDKTRADGDVRSPAYIRYQFEEGKEEIRAALEPFGHYQPTVEGELTPVEGTDQWSASYRVDPGPQVVFGAVSVELGEADADPDIAAELASIVPSTSAPFTHGAYEASKKALQNLLARYGYFENRLETHRAVVDPEAGTVEVTLALASGPRYRFGPTRFEGAQFTRPFMARFGVLPEGESFRDAELRSLQRNLAQVDYFAEAFVDARVDEANDRLEVPIVVTTTPAKRRRYTAGVTLGTDTGVGVQTTALYRWINDRGHSVQGDIEFGTRNRRAILGYKIPGPELSTSYNFSGGYDYTETDAYTEEITFLSGSRLRRWRNWNLTETLRYNSDRFVVGQQDDKVNYLLGELTAQRSAYDDRVFTRNGWGVTATLRATAEAAASDFDLLQADLSGIWIRGVGDKNRLLLRGRLGSSLTDDIFALPASLRFFTGGDRSVRGFEFESLGSRNDAGEVIGGTHVIEVSGTFEHYFLEKWGVAGFVDAGNAFDASDFIPAVGVGGGLRWISPVGLVRVDLAVGFEEDQDQVYRMHLNIGPDL